LTDIDTLVLRNDQIIGTFPAFLGDMTKLKTLNLEQNSFTGPLPGVALQKLDNLERFYVKQNSLNGTIPEELGQMSNLYDVSLSGNNFAGSIPAFPRASKCLS
jgi:Leucine-rich repeat (LRR) protein